VPVTVGVTISGFPAATVADAALMVALVIVGGGGGGAPPLIFPPQPVREVKATTRLTSPDAMDKTDAAKGLPRMVFSFRFVPY
jgi:uncharacterized protein YfaA (DUF2138 family)